MSLFKCFYQSLKVQTACRSFSSRFTDRTVNQVQLLGRIGKDPRIITTFHDTKQVIFPVVTANKVIRSDSEGDNFVWRESWHNIRVLRPAVQDLVMESMKVGTRVFLTGKLRSIRIGSEEPVKYATIVVADQILILSHAPQDRDTGKDDDFDKMAVETETILESEETV